MSDRNPWPDRWAEKGLIRPDWWTPPKVQTWTPLVTASGYFTVEMVHDGIEPAKERICVLHEDSAMNGAGDTMNLISAAPALYRALAAVEWGGRYQDEPACPDCGAWRDNGGAHAPYCALNAALKQARGDT